MDKRLLFYCLKVSLAILAMSIWTICYSAEDRQFLRVLKQAMPPRGCISQKNKLMYVHIPKVGGSTMENSGLFDDVPNTGGHFSIDYMKNDPKGERDEDSFITSAHIRHPCDRFISAFYYLKDKKGNAGDQAWAAQHIGDMSIDEFVQKHAASKWTLPLALHFAPMHEFLFHQESEEFGIDELLCQEHWQEGVTRLFSRVNVTLPSKFVESNTTQKDPSSHLLANNHETCADLNEQTREKIESHYAMDYCVFNYPFIQSKDDEIPCIGTRWNKSDFTFQYKTCKDLTQSVII